ncbi:DUF2891 domain-containing protein [Solitalea koreensis]|uniref:DUF2891 domain-containing protein n=1 Tax=Solitalea koreensis TaxID=543615 RepID=A0A521C0C4_9SPHI|nr:DUF2891 domain-containing protein [Solitalea koreensis]SMO52180.1 Protein of unknown function [Solitalea koreensis]
MRRKLLITTLLILSTLKMFAQTELYKKENGIFKLTEAGASHFAALPLKCMQQEYPYKTGIVFFDSSLVTAPKNYHPAFYGCFDWHSSVHGHWMLVKLLKMYPNLPQAAEIRSKLKLNLTAANIEKEVQLFKNNDNKAFERTYGWSWLLQLYAELQSWNDPLGKELAANVKPLTAHFSSSYINYLQKLVYPIRVGEHTNLAFGLSLAWDYAVANNDAPLQASIKETAMRFYFNDKGCPMTWEPNGSDFLSPCLEEADLMWRILPKAEYQKWLKGFLPVLFQRNIVLEPGKVLDRTDGKLVHLDGLNLSRAWCLYGIARHAGKNKESLIQLANKHMEEALPHVASGDYAGEHWLASFAVYALTAEANK